ncbi:MAG: hypothetical protein GX206_05305 [Clostridiales bacterium]|nr:hypothetical protein [Clostridiales bacterium]
MLQIFKEIGTDKEFDWGIIRKLQVFNGQIIKIISNNLNLRLAREGS